MARTVKPTATRQPPVGDKGWILHSNSDWLAPLPRGKGLIWSEAHERRHAGIDLKIDADVAMTAPEDGKVYAVLKAGFAYGKEPPPFTHYGPEVVAIKGASGAYHWLAHLRGVKDMLAPGTDVVKNQPLADNVNSGALNHTHWEVRSQAYATERGRGQWLITMDPVSWILGFDFPANGGAQGEAHLKAGNPLRPAGSYVITLEGPRAKPAVIPPVPAAAPAPAETEAGGLWILAAIAGGVYVWTKTRRKPTGR